MVGESLKYPILIHLQASTVYVPDFLIQYSTQNGRPRVEMIEVKPKSTNNPKKRLKLQDRAFIALNRAKWKAAGEWCKRKGIMFRILNEDPNI